MVSDAFQNEENERAKRARVAMMRNIKMIHSYAN